MAFLPGLSNFLFGKNVKVPSVAGAGDILNSDPYKGWISNLTSSGQDVQNLAGQNFGMSNSLFGQAGQAGAFNPYGISSGMGGVQNTPYGLNLSNPWQNTANSLMGYGAANVMNPQGYDFSGLMGQAGQGATFGLNQAMQNPLGMGAGLLNQAANYDPMAAAQDRYNTMESMLQPSRQQQWNDITQQLYGMGQLGSAGDTLGSRTLQSFGQGVENQRQQNLLNAITSSEGTQNMLYNQGIGLGGLGLQTQGQGASMFGNMGGLFSSLPGLSQQYGMNQQGMGMNALNAGQTFNQMPLSLLPYSLQAGQAGSQAGLGQVQNQLGALGAGQGALNLMGMMPNIYQNLITAGLGYQTNANSANQNAAMNSGRSGGFLGGIAGGLGQGLGSMAGAAMFL